VREVELPKAEGKASKQNLPQQSVFPKQRMENFKPQKLVNLDGRVGEGGGQVVRIAMALAALTRTPLRIENIRGNRYNLSNSWVCDTV
jgi:hypothetical protein